MFKQNRFKIFIFTMMFSILSAKAAQAASYSVVSGDTLYSIGRLFNTSVTILKQNNNLTSDYIFAGQKLTVQAAQYSIKSGDTLYSISRNYGVTVDALRKANGEWDNYIYPGQVLAIPAGSTAVVQSPTGTVAAPKAVVSYTANELDLLARLIRAEAEGQPYTAKVAVGAVVVNRVKSPIFPSTVTNVVYERSYGYYQFTPVANGMINKVATQEDIKAAYDALHGNDPTRGALYYFDDSATNQSLLL